MITIQERLASFRPVAVEETLEAVRRDHPIVGTAIPTPETDLLAVVRQRLLDATEAVRKSTGIGVQRKGSYSVNG